MGNLFYDEPRVERKPYPFKARPYSEVGREPRVGDRVIVVDAWVHWFAATVVRKNWELEESAQVPIVGEVFRTYERHDGAHEVRVEFPECGQSGRTEMFALVEEGVSA